SAGTGQQTVAGQHEIPLCKTKNPCSAKPSTALRGEARSESEARSGCERRASLDAPTAIELGDDVDSLERADQRIVDAPAAELHLQMYLALADMNGRALVPSAVMPTVTGACLEVVDPIVARFLPDGDLAAGQPDVGEVAGRVDGCLVAAIEPAEIVVERSHRHPERIAHAASNRRQSPCKESAAPSPRRRASAAPRSSAPATTSDGSRPTRVVTISAPRSLSGSRARAGWRSIAG